MSFIEIKNLSKNFGCKEVLKNFNLSVEEGERVGILGANGCGKTTLVEIIALVSQPTSGEVCINIKDDVKKEIGIQFQEGTWPKNLRAKDILDFYLTIYPKFTNNRYQELLELFEVKEFLKKPLNKLSGGQKQRFNAMLSVINIPQILILDELTTGLHMQLQFKIIEYIDRLIEQYHQTLFLVSHHAAEVETLCNRLIILKDGVVYLDIKKRDAIATYGGVREMMMRFFAGEL